MDEPSLLDNTPEYTVSELSGSVKRTIEGAFGRVRVRGELGRVSTPRSGHVYLDLKDDKAVLGSVIWKGVASRLDFRPEEGLEVVAEGRLTTYPGQSKYQLVIERMEPAGAGALMALLEQRKAQFRAEGLFDDARKKALPYLPDVIGVVTSPSGAVIRDILHRLADRFGRRVLVWPVAVQGERCEQEVAAAITGFNHLPPESGLPRPDVLIVARGGGSVEDLWGFNGERVVRAVAASSIPVISAVGHETDWTLIDLVADRRAPTPTAAAEMAVPVRAELVAQVQTLDARRQQGWQRLHDGLFTSLRAAIRGLPRVEELILPAAQRLDAASGSIDRALVLTLERARRRLGEQALRLQPAEIGRAIGRWQERLADLMARRDRAGVRQHAQYREQLSALARRHAEAAPRRLLSLAADRLRDLEARIGPAIRRLMHRRGEMLLPLEQRIARLGARATERPAQTLAGLATRLEAANPTALLARGFVLIRDDNGRLLRSAGDAADGTRAHVRFTDGERQVTFNSGSGTRPAKARAKPARAAKKPVKDQGSLF